MASQQHIAQAIDCTAVRKCPLKLLIFRIDSSLEKRVPLIKGRIVALLPSSSYRCRDDKAILKADRDEQLSEAKTGAITASIVVDYALGFRKHPNCVKLVADRQLGHLHFQCQLICAVDPWGRACQGLRHSHGARLSSQLHLVKWRA